MNEILTNDQINEIADAPAGVVDKTIRSVRIAQEDPYYKAGTTATTAGPAVSAHTLSSKSDADRTGVQGSTPSAQTSEKAVKEAPQIATAGTEKSPGAKELDRMGRDPGKADDKAKQEKKIDVESGMKGTDHAG